MWKSQKIGEQFKITELYTMFEVSYTDGYEFNGETHNFWECLYVTEGDVWVTADEKVYNLKSGQIIFHKPLELHKFYSDTPCKKGSLFIFSFSMTGGMCEFFKDKVFTLSDSQREILQSLLRFARSECTPDGSYDELMYLKNPSPSYTISLASYLTLLFLSLYENNNAGVAQTSPDSALFSEAVSYMNRNIERTVTIEEIAKHLSIGQSTLKRLFGKYAGLGVHKYFLKLKIKAATEMLENGESVTVVAERLGFASQGYFSAAFKRETGFSPTEQRG